MFAPCFNENQEIHNTESETFITLRHELIHVYNYIFGGKEDKLILSVLKVSM